jgi:hypothetical protein
MSATLLLFACPAALGFAGAYWAADRPSRRTLRLIGAAALWVASIAVITISLSRS